MRSFTPTPRKQAIEDGVLVDLSGIETIKEHWKYPFARTSTVWAIIETALQEDGQDLDGICHAISWMAFIAIRVTKDLQVVHFKVLIAGKKHVLKLHFGPGETAAPVFTPSPVTLRQSTTAETAPILDAGLAWLCERFTLGTAARPAAFAAGRRPMAAGRARA